MGVLALLFAGLLVFGYGRKMGWWEERRLVLAAVEDASVLMVGSPVFYRGVEIGAVTRITPPSPESPGYKLRMAVDKNAFIHIAVDSRVRVEKPGPGRPAAVVILPGREKIFDFPGKVKVLREVTPAEDALRLVLDLLKGLENLSKAKSAETEAEELNKKLRELEQKLDSLQEDRHNERPGSSPD